MRVALVGLLAFGALVVPAGSASTPRWLVPTPIGAGARFHPRALSARVAERRSVGGLRCETGDVRRFGVHLELFAHGRVVVVPAGIAVAPPWRTVRPHVIEGACSYPARTRTAIGVIEIASGSRISLGQLFALWGQPLGRHRLAGFHTTASRQVRAYVDGVEWHGSPRTIPLRRHSAVALEVGRHVPPHPSFRFGMGL
jgi:hypothetical protein